MSDTVPFFDPDSMIEVQVDVRLVALVFGVILLLVLGVGFWLFGREDLAFSPKCIQKTMIPLPRFREFQRAEELAKMTTMKFNVLSMAMGDLVSTNLAVAADHLCQPENLANHPVLILDNRFNVFFAQQGPSIMVLEGKIDLNAGNQQPSLNILYVLDFEFHFSTETGSGVIGNGKTVSDAKPDAATFDKLKKAMDALMGAIHLWMTNHGKPKFGTEIEIEVGPVSLEGVLIHNFDAKHMLDETLRAAALKKIGAHLREHGRCAVSDGQAIWVWEPNKKRMVLLKLEKAKSNIPVMVFQKIDDRWAVAIVHPPQTVEQAKAYETFEFVTMNFLVEAFG